MQIVSGRLTAPALLGVCCSVFSVHQNMHPRTQYLADAGKNDDPALQPLLQYSSRTDQEAAVEPPAKDEQTAGSAAPSAPLLSAATGSALASAEHAPTTAPAYGLPSGYRAQYAEAPPALQSLRSPTQVVPPANQPMQQSYRMQTLGSFDDEPAIITCTQCRATGQTYTHKESGCCVWFSAITCIFLGCWPCARMPFCVGSCKDTVHRCSNCGRVVGKHAWGR